MNIMVTGGAGFIGSHVVDRLLLMGHRVLVLDNFSSGKMSNLRQAQDEHGSSLRIEHCDITNVNDLRLLMLHYQPLIIVHLAAQAAITTSLDSPGFDLAVNAGGMLNLIQVAREASVRRIVFSSTSAVYKSSLKRMKEGHELHPDSPYGISKLAAEFYLSAFWKDRIILRFGNVYGPRQIPIGENQVIPRMIRHLQFGEKFYIYGSGEQTRDFVYVEDVAAAVADTLQGRKGIYNIATGQSLSVNTLAAHLEKLYEIPGYRWEYQPAREEREQVKMDPAEAYRGLGWKAIAGIVFGLQKTVQWWRDNDPGLHLT